MVVKVGVSGPGSWVIVFKVGGTGLGSWVGWVSVVGGSPGCIKKTLNNRGRIDLPGVYGGVGVVLGTLYEDGDGGWWVEGWVVGVVEGLERTRSAWVLVS